MENYHRHSHYSNIILPDSVATNEDYCKRAKQVGHTILSSCEHGTPGNYRQCAELAKKYGLRWRYVAEAYMVKDRFEKDKTNCHIILAAKTKKGIGDINEVLSEANLTGYYYRARVDIPLLLTLNPADVFVTTACIGGIWNYGVEYPDETNKKIKRYNFTEPDRIVKILHSHFKDSFMLEVQNHNTPEQKKLNQHILSIYRREGIKIIAGLDSHFIYEEDSLLRDQLLESRHLKYEEESGWYMDYPDDETCIKRFEEQGILSTVQINEAMNNADIFREFEDVEFDKSKKLPTIYPDKTQEERNDLYRKLIDAKWNEYKSSVPIERWPDYEEAIKYEVDTVTSTNTSDYFLLDYHIVKRFKELGGRLTYTGRGSGPSYFTNTLLGFSSIDRLALPITMYPDRFISADRLKAGSMPDLDMNVADPEIFAKAQEEVIGKGHSAPMIAYGTLKRLSAWKMYCRASNVPFEIANRISDDLKKYELDYKHADEDEQEFINPFDYVPKEYHEQLRMSEKYLGMVDSISQHPCAYAITNEDIKRQFGIFRMSAKTGSKKDVYAAFIDGATADAFGYLKNDNLKVEIVRINADVYKSIGMKQPSVPELIKLVENDKDIWAMYSKGFTLGLNQAEKEKSTEKVMTYKPKNVTEMTAFCAGIRPGFQSMANTMFTRQRFSYHIPALDRMLVTKEMPDSFILYQEQVMKILQYGGFLPSESYAAIKAIAKKHPQKVLPLKGRFLENFTRRLVEEEHMSDKAAQESAMTVWGIIEDNTSYSFNCVSGDTVLMRASNKKSAWRPTIAQMYRVLHDKEWAKQNGHKDLHSKYHSYGYGTCLSLYEDNRIRENIILDIVESGMQCVYEITTETGKTIKATAGHKFPVGAYDNYVELKDLSVGDLLFVCGEYEKNTNKYLLGGRNNLPKKGQLGFQKLPNGDLYNKTRASYTQQQCPCQMCGKEYSKDVRFELRRIDGNRTNNVLQNYKWLCVSCHKKQHYKMGRVSRYKKGIPSNTEKIVSITKIGYEPVYDVVMNDKYHNFVISNGIVTGNCSHACCVALDSIYTAYAKAHYPYETYCTLLRVYAERGDKDRIDRAKKEMKQAFGIRMVPCKFRQDNRDYFVDKQNHTISDAMVSIKGIGKKDAEAFYKIKDMEFSCFTMLCDYLSNVSGAANSGVIETLIRCDYFSEFGRPGKLLKVYRNYRDGQNKITKTLKDTTKQRRLDNLCVLESLMEQEELPISEIIKFEADKFGSPYSIFKEAKKMYYVVEVNTTYSPKLKLYQIEDGKIGTVKVKKEIYKDAPIEEGDIIIMQDFEKKIAYGFANGKPVKKPGVFDVWITKYHILEE